MHDGADEEHGVDVAGLVAQGQPIAHLVDVPKHQLQDAPVLEALCQRRLEAVVVDALEEVPDVALDDRALGVVPLLHRAVRQTGSAPRRLVRALLAEKVGPHVLLKHFKAEVYPFPDLGGVGIPRQAPG